MRPPRVPSGFRTFVEARSPSHALLSYATSDVTPRLRARKRHVAAENLVRTLTVQEHLAAMLLGQICDLPPYVGALSRKWLVHVVDGFAVVLAEARFRETRSFQLELRIASQEMRNELCFVADLLIGRGREGLDAGRSELRG